MKLPFEEYLNANLPEYFELLRRMVAINSFTINAHGVNTLGHSTAEVFSAFGFQAEFVPSSNHQYGKHLFLKHQPAQKLDGIRKSIVFISHLDTVYPPEEEVNNNFYFRCHENRIYGPGSVDIKGGTVLIYMILDVMRNFAPDLYDQTEWLIGINASEEVLSEDFGRSCIERIPANAKACLVFEGGTPNETGFSLVTARKGRATFHIEVEGRGAHAGNYHQSGANAIVQISDVIQKIAGFTDYTKQITFNVGVVRGGSVVNRVPHEATAEVEMRAFHPDIFNDGVKKMLSLDGYTSVSSLDGYPCIVTVQLRELTNPWPPNEQTEHLYSLWSHTAETMGYHTIAEHRGGLSDANYLWQFLPTLDGLGPEGANAHCSEASDDGSKDQEYALATSFVPKAALNTASIMKLLEVL